MNQAFTLNEIKVSYSLKLKSSERPQVTSSKAVYELVLPVWEDIELVESFKVLLLSQSNRVLGISHLFRGGLSSVVVDPKQVFQVALKCNAAAIIVMHNHPSGRAEGSQADQALTDKLKEIGKLLNLRVLDHVVLTSESYYSFADEGLLL